MISAMRLRSGGLPAFTTAPTSRKKSGLSTPGVMVARKRAVSVPRLTNWWTAPRGMKSAWPGASASSRPSTLNVHVPGDRVDGFVVGHVTVRRGHAGVGRDDRFKNGKRAVGVRALEEVADFKLADADDFLG